MNKFNKIIRNTRVIILVVALLLMIVTINPHPNAQGVAIRNIISNSSAADAGIENVKPSASPMSRERIVGINNQPIRDLTDYYDFVETMVPNRTYVFKTTKGSYSLVTRPILKTTELNETETKIISETREVNVTINGTNQTINQTFNTTVVVPKTTSVVVGMEDLGLSVYKAPTNNLRKGLDLQGGTRVLLKPETEISAEDMDTILSNMKERLNVYGLSDVVVRPSTDLDGTQYILVEIAGANEDEVKELLAKQGKFEAKIGSETVFVGGTDITYVCRSADCSGIDPSTGCGQVDANTWTCRFRFSIALTPEAAERQASLTKDLELIVDGTDEYLNESIDLFLDNSLVDSLNIGADLQGRAVTDIQISGSGVGPTHDQAVFDSLENMKKLQTVLITGSLPVKLEIENSRTVSPVLGEEFTKNAMIMGLLAILAVGLVVFVRYKQLKISLPVMFTMISEAVLLLGMAALIGQNLDLAAIAGILIAIGTGVDDQIVITDEIKMRKNTEVNLNWKRRIKRAFFIIMASYFTTVVAMLPLIRAGAGLLKGFAITTILGVTLGVFITRPAFAKIVEILMKK